MIGWSAIADKLLGFVGSAALGIISYFRPPRVAVVPAETRFGWLNNGRFALLLTVELRNESERPTLIRPLRVKFGDSWHEPESSVPDTLFLAREHGGSYAFRLDRQGNVAASLHVPPVNVVKRFGFFLLPDPAERWPTEIVFTGEIAFTCRRTRRFDFKVLAG